MRRVLALLVFALLMTGLPTAYAQDAAAPAVEDYLVNPAMVVGDLPLLLTAAPIHTSRGDLRTTTIIGARRLFFQYDEGDYYYFNVPEDWGFDSSGAVEVSVSPDGSQITYCNYPVTNDAPLPKQGVGILIDTASGSVNLLDQPCVAIPDQSGYSYSEPTTSPDGSFMVSVVPTRDAPEDACPRDDLIEPFGYPSQIFVNDTLLTCINLPGIEAHGWFGEDSLLLRTFDPKDTIVPIERWYVLDAPSATLTPLGMTMELPQSYSYRPETTILYNEGTNAARWIVQSISKPTTEHPKGMPDTCALELLDLQTLDANSFDSYSCLFYPQLTVNEDADRLLYVKHEMPDDPALIDHPVATPMLVDLAAHTEQALSISGTIVHLVSMSPDGGRALMVVDQSPDARQNPYENGIAYVDPRWIVYDLNADEVLYTSPSIEQSYYGYIFDSGFGLVGFTWKDDGWIAIFNPGIYRLPLSLMRWQDGGLTEIALEDIPRSFDRYFVGASPDGAYMRVISGDDTQPQYLVDSAVGTVIPFAKPYDGFADGNAYYSVIWRDDGKMEIRFTSTTNVLMLVRWLVDPALGFAN